MITLFLLACAVRSYALVELSGNFGYDRQIYGENRDNKYVERTYSGAVAVYLWGLTAIEFSYSKDLDVITDNSQRILDPTITILNQQDRTTSEVFGIGLKQAFTGRKSFLQPIISLGYAKDITRSEVDYTVDISGVTQTLNFDVESTKTDSVFGVFTLRLKITERFTINGSIRTVFPYFETDKARDNVKYLAGFSWFL